MLTVPIVLMLLAVLMVMVVILIGAGRLAASAAIPVYRGNARQFGDAADISLPLPDHTQRSSGL